MPGLDSDKYLRDANQRLFSLNKSSSKNANFNGTNSDRSLVVNPHNKISLEGAPVIQVKNKHYHYNTSNIKIQMSHNNTNAA